jgi:two-component sensor histidine kinase
MAQHELENFDLAGLVAEVETLLRESFGEKELSVDLDVPPLEVHGDRDKIGQVLINLLTNAVKFTAPGGRISVQARPAAGGYLEVEVADSGVGIPEHLRDRIFERGFQVDGEGEKREDGSGIGLSIVRDILRLHGCRIGVESKPGRGSRFYFTLPAPETESTEASEAPAPADEPTVVPVAEAAVEAAAEPTQVDEADAELEAEIQSELDAAAPGPSRPAPDPGPFSGPGSKRDDDDPPPRPRFRIIRR